MGARVGFILLLVAGGCRAEPAPPPWDEDLPGDAHGGAAESAGVADGSAKGGGAKPTSTMSAPEANSPAAGAAGAAPDGSDDATFDGCGTQRVTLEQIHAGKVRAGVGVSVGPLLASSQKFLVSEAKSGSCLWGAFAADPQRRGAGSGLFLVSFGAPHVEGEACQPGSDGLPDDLAPGELLKVSGKLDEYVPAACQGVAAAPQLVIDAACPLERDGAVAAPEPQPIDAALADRLATGGDATLLREWSGALVQLRDVSARQDEDGDAVFPFGVIRLAETALEVHSRLYYFDLSEGGPKSASKAPRYGYPTTFDAVTGIVFLDYCSWVLAPRQRCRDLSPVSEGCAASAVGP